MENKQHIWNIVYLFLGFFAGILIHLILVTGNGNTFTF